MIRAIRATTLFLTFLPFLAAQAQDDIAVEVEEIRRYTVEMIIFRYAQAVVPGTEIFPGDEPIFQEPPLSEEQILDEQLLPEPAPIVQEVPTPVRDVEFVLLDEDDFTMGEIMGHIKRLDVYDPIMHFGWTQVTWPEEETQNIELAYLGELPEGLDGNLKLYLSRYLHLVVDLQLDAPDIAVGNTALDEPVSSYGDYRTLNAYEDSAQPGPVRYRIEENRILRNGDLRYFDHPKFGVLAKVTRVEEELEQMLPTDETELLGYPAE